MFQIIIYEILVIFAFVGIGFFAYKVKFLTDDSVQHLTKLMINVTGPCMLLTSITENQFSEELARAAVQILIGTAVFFVAGIFVASLFLKVVGIPKEDAGVYNMLITTQNSGFMGFPLAQGIFGNEGLFFMVLSNLVMNIYMYTVGLLQINIGTSRKKKSWKSSVKSLFNPCSVTSAAGIILLLLHIDFPVFIKDVITPLGDATIPISMIVLGVQLGMSRLREIIRNKKLIWIAGISLIIWPFLTFLALNWLPLYRFVKVIMVFAAALPGMVMLVALAEQEGKNTQAAAEGVALTTLFSMLTLPVITFLLKFYYGI